MEGTAFRASRSPGPHWTLPPGPAKSPERSQADWTWKERNRAQENVSTVAGGLYNLRAAQSVIMEWIRQVSRWIDGWMDR